MQLSADRKPLVSIFIKEAELNDKNSPVRYAAKELRYYLGRMTAVSFQIEAYRAEGAGICVGDCAGIDTTELGEDGFVIRSVEDRLCIAGGKRGVIYGVYELLERLGCRFFAKNCEYIPTIPDLVLADDYNITDKPVMEFRSHTFTDAIQSSRFAVKCRLNGAGHNIPEKLGGHLSYVWFVHTFDKMVPVAVYGETHPEYFAEVDGKRIVRSGGRTQLCLTNPEVLELCIESVRKALREHPEAKLISISQNDWRYEYCHCPDCVKSDAEHGSPAGTLIKFVNTIAERLEPEFPDVIFDTLAYHYNRPAPTSEIRARHNVCVRICSIEACFSHPFTAGHDARPLERNDGKSFIDDLRDWGKHADRLYMWDYTTCFAHYATPHPNWRVLQPNLQTMAENNVRGVYEQGNSRTNGGIDCNELRLYLLGKLLWNPWCDIEKHRREFMEHFYGAAAPYLDEYLNLVCDTAEAHDHVGFNDNPDKHSFLTEEMLDRYDAIFEKALQAVVGDPLRLWRVEKNRLCLRYVRLKRATMRGEYDADAINKFFGDWQAFGLSHMEEWFNLDSTLRAFLDGNWRATAYFEHWVDEDPDIV